MKELTGLDPRTGRSLAITIGDGRITSMREGPAHESAYLAPGLIDLQINGYRGHDLNAETLHPQTVVDLAREVARTGVTTFFPTLITQSEDRLIAALQAITEARREDSLTASMIAGIHIEGPSISPQDGPRGAHPHEHIRPPSLAEFDRWQAAAAGLVQLVTLSPHFPEAFGYIAALRNRGVFVSVGHTHCSAAEIHAAAGAGAQLSTHLGNGVAGHLPRHPNMLWAQLADDRFTAMVIADGHHLPDDTLRVILRAKGSERIILVSDLVAVGGLPPGHYQTPIGGDVELTPDGRLGLAGTPFLAGAALPLKDGIAHLVNALDIPLGEALALATTNPGCFAGGRGHLAVGEPADLLRFHLDQTLHIDTVLVQGEEIA